MNEENYSDQWSRILSLSKEYQIELYNFLSNDEALITNDLRTSLTRIEDCYYALKVIKNIGDTIKIKLLKELIYVVIYSNVSNAAEAKKIILDINSAETRNTIVEYIQYYIEKERQNEDVLKDIALLLYDLNYKKELVSFIDSFKKELEATEFIDNDILGEINSMKEDNR